MRFGKKMRFLVKPRRESAWRKRFRKKTLEYLTGKPMELADPPLLPTHANTILLTEAQLCDWYFFILFVIDDFVWSGLRKKIGDLGFFFFFFPCYGLVVVVVVVAVADIRGGCDWCYGCFFDSEIYYFIMMFILFCCVES